MKVRTVLLITIALSTTGCPVPRKNSAEPEKRVVVVEENKVPGTVDTFWVEPMHDTVEVPAQIDPTGTYYRNPHKTVVEVRPDRFRKVEQNNAEQGVNAPSGR